MMVQGQVILILASTPGLDSLCLHSDGGLAKVHWVLSQQYFVEYSEILGICMYLIGCSVSSLYSQTYIYLIGYSCITLVLRYRSHDTVSGSLPTSPYARRLHLTPPFRRHRVLPDLGHPVPRRVDLRSSILSEAACAVVLSRTRRRESRQLQHLMGCRYLPPKLPADGYQHCCIALIGW